MGQEVGAVVGGDEVYFSALRKLRFAFQFPPFCERFVHIDTILLARGYRIKLIIGRHYDPIVLRSKVAEIQANVPAGIVATSNPCCIGPY